VSLEIYNGQGRLDALPLDWLKTHNFRLGVRPFTSMRITEGQLELWSYHKRRLATALELLAPEYKTPQTIFDSLERTLGQIRTSARARIELFFFQNGHVDWLLALEPLPEDVRTVRARFFDGDHQSKRGSSSIKQAYYFKEYLLTRELANGEEAVFADPVLGVREGVFSNVFIFRISGESPTVIAPLEGEDILEGVYFCAFKDFLMRKKIVLRHEKIFYNELSREDVLVLSNCVRGFRRAHFDHDPSVHLAWNTLLELEREFLDDQKENPMS
jgi:branched-subunit amino acid aminotransferase/4-amino-4-deoxychorismate lyase